MSKIKSSLIHKGPLFPKPYEYKGIYKLNGVVLNPMLEKLVYKWAVMGEDYRKDPKYTENARPTIKRWANPELKNCVFPDDYMSLMEKMRADNEEEKAAKKAANTKEARQAKKAETEKIKAEYGVAEVDGKRQQLGGYMLEPEGWYIGRGQCPIRGLWKYEIQPEDVTINYFDPKDPKNLNAPKAPVGHHWKDIVANKNAFVSAYYDIHLGEGVVDLHKKFNFGILSDVKQDADIHKYDKAQQLAKDWDKVEKWIDKGVDEKKQEALIAWLILRTGIRVGGVKQQVFENFTVGASTILVKNIDLNGTKLKLHFLGKDSVKYINELDVPQNVADGIAECLKGKKPTEKVFDKVNASTVNGFLQDCVPYCTAKLFRTAYGTMLLAKALQEFYNSGELKKGMPEWKVKSLYDKACLTVSKKLNHQKNVSKNFTTQIEKVDEGVVKAKEAAKKRKDKATEQLKKIKNDIAVAKKCFEGEKLKEKLAKLKEKKDKIAAQVERSQERIEKLEDKKDFKQATKNIALGTAKNAYSSPKIAYSFAKDFGVDVGIVYSKTLQKKFAWASNTPASFWRNYPN